MDRKGDKVESFKLTPEQKGFQKRFRALKEVQALLARKTFTEQMRFKSLQQMWQALNGQFQMLGSQTPKEPTYDLPGMSFPQNADVPGGMQSSPTSQSLLDSQGMPNVSPGNVPQGPPDMMLKY